MREFKHLVVNLRQKYPEEILQVLQLAQERGVIHTLEIELLSGFQEEDRNLIIEFFNENSQNILIQRFSCDVDDFHAHFHILNALNVTLYTAMESVNVRSPLTLRNATRNLFCFDFIPVFEQTFPNLNKLSLYFMDNQLDLDQYANFANSYQHLDLLQITVGVHSEIEELERELEEIYANSPKTFKRIRVFREELFE